MKNNLQKRALMLSYLNVGYHLAEEIISIGLGVITGSIALIGFGLDSVIEMLSGIVMIWRFKHKCQSKQQEHIIDRKAQKLVAYTFFILGTYVLYEAIKKLIFHEVIEPSLLGIGIAILSIIVMPIMAHLKHQTGKLLNSQSLLSDSMESYASAWMSAVLLIALGVNYFFGLWWVDPLAGLFFVVILWREGYEAYTGNEQ
jgi:divalent metal cation (Fe/Co/Zn/Cd) transporter